MKRFLIALSSVTLLLAGCSSFQTTTSVITPVSTVSTNGGVVTTNTTLVTNLVTTVNSNAVTQLSSIVEMSAELGTYSAVQNDPSSAQYFQLAAQTISTAIANGTYNSTNLEQSVEAIVINGKTNPNVTLAVKAAFILYGSFASQVVSQKLDQNAYLQPILNALDQGIIAGLDTKTVAAKRHLPTVAK